MKTFNITPLTITIDTENREIFANGEKLPLSWKTYSDPDLGMWVKEHPDLEFITQITGEYIWEFSGMGNPAYSHGEEELGKPRIDFLVYYTTMYFYYNL
jgi:hypothetical protein